MMPQERPDDHGAALQGWLETLEEPTRHKYGRHVEGALAAGGGQLTAEGFLAYRNAEYARGLAASTIGVLAAAVRGFARYLAKSALISSAEVRGIWDVPRLPVHPRPEPVEVNDGFVGRMAAAAERDDDSQLRVLTARAVLVLLAGSGLEADEAVAVQWCDYGRGGSTASKGGAKVYVHRPSGFARPRTRDVSAKGARVLDELRSLHCRLVSRAVSDVPVLAALWDDAASAAGLLVRPRPPATAMLERVVDRLAQRAGAPAGTVRSDDLQAVYEARQLRVGSST